ncbi:MAG TPA: N-acetylmuramoyl-L-alanine amidase [Candidatus Onthocola gallistercoris]|uniref:N-acetylmuramoyl-L-alanine amidase n=1 Tax=Candidatus Onthocola gallistercoris TaxID=2840876 RepID=A0A9D1HIR5_9FIRM|nr:N-acetylmuramoyl-L-alanine amidase [Candidatus Onthocola gallistercoris]
MKKLAVICVLVGLLALSVLFYRHTYVEVASALNDQVKEDVITVVIDAGHGGNDPGGVGVSGVLEKDVNLNVAKFLQSDLEQQGIQVVMTREEDKGLYSENASNKKREDLANRIGVITDTAPDFVICIHQNSFTDPMYKGAQVFYYKDSEEGARLASAIQEQLIAGVDPSNTRVAKSNMNYYMLKHSPAPMVIVECGFLTNTEEEALLGQEDYQRKLAWNIYLGIMQYLNSSGDTDAAA